MHLKRYFIAAGTAALLISVSPVLADDAATPAATTPAAPAAASNSAPAVAPTTPAAPAAVAAPAAQAAPAPQVPEKVQAWAKFCDAQADGHNICIVRKLAFQATSIVGSFVLRVDSAKGVPTLAVGAVPVGVVLKPGLKWQIDTGKAQSLSFWRCTQQSCESEQLVNADFINRLRKGNNLKLTAKDVAGKDFVITIPLAGFAAAYDMKDAPTFAEYTKSLQ